MSDDDKFTYIWLVCLLGDAMNQSGAELKSVHLCMFVSVSEKMLKSFQKM